MAFLDEEQQEVVVPEEPERPRRRIGGPQRRRQQYLVRRLIGVGVGLGFLILVVIGIRGCLEARSDRALRNYAQDVGTIMQESEQRGTDFFDLINSPSGASTLDVRNQIYADRDASQSLVERAEKIDVPGEMSDPQSAVKLSLTLRRDGLSSIADSLPQATADAQTSDAIENITKAMGELYSSDILWTQVGSPEITSTLQKDGVEAPALPAGNFMPDDATDFLDQTGVVDKLGGIVGTTSTGGSHGLGLLETSIGDTTLAEDQTTEVASDSQEIEVQVQNQGESDESGIDVTVTFNGGTLHGTIQALDAGEASSVKIPLTTKPQPGTDTSVEVVVEPVPGEQVADNNQASYTVVFGSG